MEEQNISSKNIADIAEYSMIIDQTELEYWIEKGWVEKEYKKLEGRAKKMAQMFSDYPEDYQTIIKNLPVVLKDYDCKQLIGRRIWSFSAILGDYGMGGPGFFGLLLDDEEYLTYAVWGSGRYVLVDDNVVECNLELYSSCKPLYSNYGGHDSWDKLRPLINGAQIIDYQLEEHQFTIKFQKKKEIHQIRFVKNDTLIPCGEEKREDAYSEGCIGDYLLFQYKNATLHV
jgi:hypothetical protein